MSLASQLAAYKVTVNADVSTQTGVNTIDPAAVGAIGSDLVDIIEPFMTVINNYGITKGTGIPSDLDGEDLDQYTRVNGSTLTLYKKISGAWVEQISYDFGYTLPDGPLTLRTTISGDLVTVTLGGWVIDNVIYQKLTQTQFTLTDADLNYTRYDLIYADKFNAILKTDGVASVSPAYPATPADCVVVDYAIVQSSSSGNSPYLLYGGGTLANSKITVNKNQDNIYPASNPSYILFTDALGVQIPDDANFNMFITGADGVKMELVGSVYEESGIRKIRNLPDGNFNISFTYQ